MKKRKTAKARVLKEWPMAWYNKEAHTIEGYSHGLVLGRGSILARSVEADAWRDAAKQLRRRR
jgi:hypothetical protein